MMLRKLLITLIVVASLAGAVAPAAAQSNQTATPTATPASSTNSTAILAVDPATNLVDKSYNRNTGTLTLTFESDRYAPVNLLVVEETDSQSGSANFRSVYLQPNQKTQVQIRAPPNSRVWISTDLARENGRISFVKTTESGGLLTGPWSGADVRDAALASASGVALMVLYRLVVERSAINKDGERVA